jgi:hypothetical protein
LHLDLYLDFFGTLKCLFLFFFQNQATCILSYICGFRYEYRL